MSVRLPSFNDFSPTILRKDIRDCLRDIASSGGDDRAVIASWANRYFGGKTNKRSSTNMPATLRSTGLTTGVRPMALSDFGNAVMSAPTAKDAAVIFCAEIIRNRNGQRLIEAITSLNKRKERITKIALKDELGRHGVTDLSINTTDHTTLVNWMRFAGLLDDEGLPDDAALKSALGITATEHDEFQSLTLGQQVFLRELRKLHEAGSGPFPVNEIFGRCVLEYPDHFDEAQFAKKIRKPLESSGWIEIEGLATGPQGGRSGKVSGTSKLTGIPLSSVLPNFDQVVPADIRTKLNTPLDEISRDLFGANKHKAGLALELLALRMIMDLGLAPRHFRLRSAQTAFAEVDLIAEGAHLHFARWTFQCKRHEPTKRAKIGVSEVAKEAGIAIYSRAHVVVMVTTTDFSREARNFAEEMSRATHLQFVFVDGKTVKKYLSGGRPVLREYFEDNAKQVMEAKQSQPLPTDEAMDET